MLRASGIQWDLRKVDNYECYEEFDWEVQWQKEDSIVFCSVMLVILHFLNLDIKVVFVLHKFASIKSSFISMHY